MFCARGTEADDGRAQLRRNAGEDAALAEALALLCGEFDRGGGLRGDALSRLLRDGADDAAAWHVLACREVAKDGARRPPLLAACVFAAVEDERLLYCPYFATNEVARGRGAGRALCRAMRAAARGFGCARTVVPARDSAVGFWRRGRFEELERSGRAATAAAAARLGIGEFTGARLLVYHHRRWRTWAVV